VRVLVVAAAGRTGRLVVAQALERGHTVTAFARRPLPDGAHAAVVGDATDPGAVGAAARDQDAVIAAVGRLHTDTMIRRAVGVGGATG